MVCFAFLTSAARADSVEFNLSGNLGKKDNGSSQYCRLRIKDDNGLKTLTYSVADDKGRITKKSFKLPASDLKLLLYGLHRKKVQHTVTTEVFKDNNFSYQGRSSDSTEGRIIELRKRSLKKVDLPSITNRLKRNHPTHIPLSYEKLRITFNRKGQAVHINAVLGKVSAKTKIIGAYNTSVFGGETCYTSVHAHKPKSILDSIPIFAPNAEAAPHEWKSVE